MPAQLSATPGHAASAVQQILNPASATKGLATAADTPAGDHAPSFAALFRQLAARQMSEDAGQIALALQTDPAATTGTPGDTIDALNALLPFMENFGMLPSGGESDEAPSDPSALLAPEDLAVPLAGPMTDGTAITAAELPAVEENSIATALAATTAADDAAEGVGDGMLDLSNENPALTGTQAGRNAHGTESGRGREFAAQLVAAIENSKEGAQMEGVRTPGSTSAAVQQVMAATPPNGAAPTGATTPLQIAQPVGTAGWGEEVGSRIVWMANRMESRAELVLTPPQMGRVEVSLTISGDQASANFVSANPVVREALESALPRLREVLADAGIQLGQAQVGAENPGQSAHGDKNGDNPGFDRAGNRDAGPLHVTESGMSSPAGLKSGRGLVDVFA